jgi:hypothetical protein
MIEDASVVDFPEPGQPEMNKVACCSLQPETSQRRPSDIGLKTREVW